MHVHVFFVVKPKKKAAVGARVVAHVRTHFLGGEKHWTGTACWGKTVKLFRKRSKQICKSRYSMPVTMDQSEQRV